MFVDVTLAERILNLVEDLKEWLLGLFTLTNIFIHNIEELFFIKKPNHTEDSISTSTPSISHFFLFYLFIYLFIYLKKKFGGSGK